MANQGPEKPKGSRILRRVESIMKFEFLGLAQQATVVPSPPAAPVPAAATRQNEEAVKKEKKEKKSKKEKKVKQEKRKDEKEKSEKIDSKQILIQGSQNRESDNNRGSIRYTTHDKKVLYDADLKRLPVTVCTYAERATLIAQEQAESKPTVNPTLQQLYGTTDSAPKSTGTAPVRKGSVIEYAQTLATTLELLKSLESEPPHSSNPPLLHRPPSMVLLQDAVQSLTLSDESKKNGSTPKPP